MEYRDGDGQPSGLFSAARRQARNSNELLGVLKGLIADGFLSNHEIEFLASWLVTNEEFACKWPFCKLIERVAKVLEDGRIDEDERVELHEVIQSIVGEPSPEYFVNTPTTFPLTKPEPEVIYDRNEFVLTGKFAFGTRKQCEAAIHVRGGKCCDRVTLRTQYLVIGTMSSRDWISTSWGRKIEFAAKLAETHALYVITEKRWADFLYPGERLRTHA